MSFSVLSQPHKPRVTSVEQRAIRSSVAITFDDSIVTINHEHLFVPQADDPVIRPNLPGKLSKPEIKLLSPMAIIRVS